MERIRENGLPSVLKELAERCGTDSSDLFVELSEAHTQYAFYKRAGLADKEGIYCYLDGEGNVIYVGRSSSLDRRLAQHKTGDKDLLEEAIYLFIRLCTNSEELERKLIIELQPKYNVTHTAKKPRRISSGHDNGVSLTVTTTQSLDNETSKRRINAALDIVLDWILEKEQRQDETHNQP